MGAHVLHGLRPAINVEPAPPAAGAARLLLGGVALVGKVLVVVVVMVVLVVVLVVVVVSVVVLVEIVLEMGWTAAALRAYAGERTLIRPAHRLLHDFG